MFPLYRHEHALSPKKHLLMKTTLCLTFLIFVTLAFLLNSFAQDEFPEYVVRLIYFLPSDRAPDPDIDTKLDTEIKDAQLLFANLMERHGFGRKTFRFESGDNGIAVVHHVKGAFTAAHYNDSPSDVWNELTEQFDLSKNIYLVSIDTGIVDHLGVVCFSGSVCGLGGWGNDGVSGQAVVPVNDNPAIAHELGHAFGLTHDYRFSVVNADPMLVSFCAAEWLDANRYFNDTPRLSNSPTTIQMLPPQPAPDAAIRLRFEINDPDGLHQVQLITLSSVPGWNVDVGWNVKDCKTLDGKRDTIEFVTQELTKEYANGGAADQIVLHVIDVAGNIASQSFSIDFHDVLSPTETILIPDPNLATSLRETLGLAPEAPITRQDMLGLRTFIAVDRQITNLTGLNHAILLQEVNLLFNQIDDITPLLKLTDLWRLSIGGNQIRDLTPLKALTNLQHLAIGRNPFNDITVLPSLKNLSSLALSHSPINDMSPVWELTQLDVLSIRFIKIHDLSPIKKLTKLTELQLDDNGISDISPLAALTNLKALNLWRNQISDVSPLTALTNLEALHLQENPIKNRRPLLAMLRENPDIKIYLKWDGEPLPVTLSHFRAEHTDTGVVLNWTTESELDNAGFYIYRSETKAGEFKVVNPTLVQGAGTTSERRTYTWTDTTAKPNTVYYYQIEDISHAGERKRLATVRLKGLVSASGKLLTKWAGLKSEINVD